MKNSVLYGGITAAPGTKYCGWVPVPDTDYKLPVTVINGSKEGKTVLITAAIHGYEYPSIEAAFRLAESVDPQEVSGQIIIINPVNLDGFLTRTPYLVPQDGKNLNRLFPGNPEGTLGDKIAYFLTEEFQKKADFYIDMHGGDAPESLVPHVYYPGMGNADQALRISEEAAEYVLHANFLIKSRAVNNAYNYAATIGIPALLLELGDCGVWKEDEVRLYLENIYNLLKYLKILPGKAVKRSIPAKKILKSVYIDADADGRWYAFVGKDDMVKQGQKIGEIRDLFGNILQEYYAEYDGLVLMVLAALAVRKGDPIIAYGD